MNSDREVYVVEHQFDGDKGPRLIILRTPEELAEWLTGLSRTDSTIQPLGLVRHLQHLHIRCMRVGLDLLGALDGAAALAN